MKEIVIQILTGLLGSIPQLVVLSFCIYYLVKLKSVDGFLMTVGTFIGILRTILSVFIPYLMSKTEADPYNMRFYTISSFVGFAGYMAFVVGFVILILKSTKHLRLGKDKSKSNVQNDMVIDDSF